MAARSPKMMAKLLAEFVGTFALVFTACSNNMASSALSALSIASVLMVCVYALGSVSGGHFNPAVSFGLALAECIDHVGIPVPTALLYTVVQLFAGACAGFASANLWGSDVGGASSTLPNSTAIAAGNVTYPAVSLGGGGAHHSLWMVSSSEAIYTALLVFVVLNVATCGDEGPTEKNSYFGIAIGFVIIASASAIGHISGCSLNPAVSLGISFSGSQYAENARWIKDVRQFIIYSASELSGAAIGFGCFTCVRHYLFKGESGARPAHHEARPSLVSKLLSEFLGTYVLILTVSLVVAQAAKPPLLGVVGIAASLMVMIYSLGAVSGANFNPAVSLGLLITKQLPPADFAAYLVVQFLAAFASVLTAAMIEQKHWKVALVADVTAHQGEVAVAQGSWGAIVGAEVFYTFLLVFVVLNVAVRDAPNQYYGLAIGFVIVAGGVAVGGLSGGCFNPAVAAALEIGGLFSSMGTHFGSCLIYIFSEFIGAVLAAGVFLVVSQTEAAESSEEELESDEEMRQPLTPHK